MSAPPSAVMRRQTVFIGMTPTLRLRIETTIENLLSLLDEIDGDENLEPDHAGFDLRTMDDREEDHDFEPSIGWTDRGPQAGGLNDDCEMDDADREHSGDENEPSLGWSSATDQHLALADYGTARDVCFFDGEQDSGDEPTMGTAEAWGQGPIVGVNCHAFEIIGNED